MPIKSWYHTSLMKTFRVKEDCYCEHYLHEKRNYPRKGLKKKKLKKDDEVTFINEWRNFYGYYYRVEKDGIRYDIPPEKLQEL